MNRSDRAAEINSERCSRLTRRPALPVLMGRCPLRFSAATPFGSAVGSLAEGLGHVRETRALLARVAAGDAALPSSKRLALGPVGHLQLGGEEYVDDFLLPNFYFHLVTVYAILRMSGARIGKQDFMAHLLPRLQRHIA